MTTTDGRYVLLLPSVPKAVLKGWTLRRLNAVDARHYHGPLAIVVGLDLEGTPGVCGVDEVPPSISDAVIDKHPGLARPETTIDPGALAGLRRRDTTALWGENEGDADETFP